MGDLDNPLYTHTLVRYDVCFKYPEIMETIAQVMIGMSQRKISFSVYITEEGMMMMFYQHPQHVDGVNNLIAKYKYDGLILWVKTSINGVADSSWEQPQIVSPS